MGLGIMSGAGNMALGEPQADYGSVAAVGLFVALMCVCIVVGHLLEENRWMNESITALFIGLGTGAVILFASSGQHSRVLVFSEDLFFIYLLPPIIFNAGLQVKKKQFFRNFITITLFGAVGTLISFTVISLGALGLISRLNIGELELADYLALGAIFSATDSVCTLQVLSQDETPFLYSLVFGEGVVNDATSVVLFNAIQNFDLGNINAARLLQFIGSFLYLFGTSTILGVAAGLLSAYIIKKLYFGRKFQDHNQVIVWWAGLMRGAVSIALAYNKFTRSGHTQQPSNAIMITSTIIVVLFSTIVFGLLTKPLIRLLIPARHLSREPSALSEPSSPKSFLEHLIANSPDHPDPENGISLRRPTSLRLLLASPTRSVHHYWRKFDDGFMRPVFGGRGFVPFVPGSPTESSVPLLPGNEN
nr:unnamed protein product [Digitaria exilis]